MTATAPNLVDAGEVARMLDVRIRLLAPTLLPNGREERHEWVARNPTRADGSPGSFRIRLTGAKAGLWSDFATKDAGDALDLVAYVSFGGDKGQAFRWALGWLGLAAATPQAVRALRAAVPDTAERDRRTEEEAAAARTAALRIWLGARATVRGTPVEAYLADRGVQLSELGRQPRAIRFHAGLWHARSERHWPAMVTLITAPDGAAAAVHRTWLECQDDGRVTKAPLGKDAKMVLGGYKGCAIRLWRGASGKPFREMAPDETIDITEGIEDGLSVAYACPECRVIAAVSLSNMGSVMLPPAARTVRLWRQNDTSPAAIEAFNRAVAAHFAAGRQVLLPDIPLGLKDVNDLVQLDV